MKMKNAFLQLQNYINDNKHIESIERFNIFFNNKKRYQIKNIFLKLKIFLDNKKKKIKSIELLNDKLYNKLSSMKKYALNNIKKYIKAKNILVGLNIVNEVFNSGKKKIFKNILMEIKQKSNNVYNYIIKLKFLDRVIYKITLYNKIKAMEMIKIYVEKKKIKKYNTGKNGQYSDKIIINNKLNKNSANNIIKYNNINKSQDHLISYSTNITLNSKSSSHLSKQSTVKKWLNFNKIDNTTYSFKIDSQNNIKKVEPTTQNSMSFTISTNKNEKKKSIDVNKDIENENEEEIWTINVENWEVNLTLDDSFYKNKNE